MLTLKFVYVDKWVLHLDTVCLLICWFVVCWQVTFICWCAIFYVDMQISVVYMFETTVNLEHSTSAYLRPVFSTWNIVHLRVWDQFCLTWNALHLRVWDQCCLTWNAVHLRVWDQCCLTWNALHLRVWDQCCLTWNSLQICFFETSAV